MIGKVANINFAVDHRYVDGGKCKKLIPSFMSVFENPEKFMRAEKKSGEKKNN